METLNLESFKEKIFDFENSKDWKFKGPRPAILDFYADWCGPCHQLTPIIEAVAETYKGLVDIYKIDTDKNPELASLFGIKGIPSLYFAPLEGEPAMTSGVMPEESFANAIEEIFGITRPQ
jgi:thioredoxin 1